MKKVLHITNWYPNKWNDLDGIFIKEQFNIFSEVTKSHLLHVQVRKGDKFLQYMHINYSSVEEGYYLLTKFKSNKIIELLTTILLLWALLKSNYKKYDLLHFHIAYPLLIHYYIWKKIIKIPVILSEHWTAYHFNFYMPKDTKKLDGIKRIFKQSIPLITVSKALLKDIQKFANTKTFESTIIPNIINKKYFRYEYSKSNEVPTFFIVNIWSSMKNPFPLLKGFAKLNEQKKIFHLYIGGYGDLLDDMQQFVKKNGFDDKVIFLGKMDKLQIANAYNRADAYLFSSKYETFSVVCAEALCSGLPLIGPKMDAVLEYARKKDILIVEKNEDFFWARALSAFMNHRRNYDRQEISKWYSDYFAFDKIKKQYVEFLEQV